MFARTLWVTAMVAGVACFTTEAQAQRRISSGQIKQIQKFQEQQVKAMQQAYAAEMEAQRQAALRKLEKRKAAAEAARKAKEHDRDVAKAHASGGTTTKSSSEKTSEKKTESKPADAKAGADKSDIKVKK